MFYLPLGTSGSSENILRAIDMALKKSMKVIALTGEKGLPRFEHYISLEIEGVLQQITVPSLKTPIIQESHIMIIHILCSLLDDALEGR